MTEQWRELMPNYEVSDAGRVRRSTPGRKTHAGRVMTPLLMGNGYLAVRPTVGGKNVQINVHDAVAAAFIGPKPSGLCVNHIDGNKRNNRPENLEYITHAENMRHAADAGLMVRGSRHPAAKLSDESVRALRADRGCGLSFSLLAKKYGISIATAFNVARGAYWKHIT